MISCFSPVTIPRKRKTGEYDPQDLITVPCGKCEACKLRSVEDWKHRAIYEVKHASNSYFVTLTYDEKYLTFDKDTGEPVLVKSDYKLFLKRLRHFLYNGKYGKPEVMKNTLKMRYMVCGEYGSKNNRPHYHFILFDVPWNGHMGDHLRYTLDRLELAWNKGYVHIGLVQPGAVDYVCSYVLGKYKWDKEYQSPFMYASNGIGMAYVKFMKGFHDPEIMDRNTGMQMGNGEVVTMPRYILDKLFTDEEKAEISFRKKIKLAEKEYLEMEKVKGDEYKLYQYHQAHRSKAKEYFSNKKAKRFHVSPKNK